MYTYIYIYIYISLLTTICQVGPPLLYIYTKANTFALNRLPFAIQAWEIQGRCELLYMESMIFQFVHVLGVDFLDPSLNGGVSLLVICLFDSYVSDIFIYCVLLADSLRV